MGSVGATVAGLHEDVAECGGGCRVAPARHCLAVKSNTFGLHAAHRAAISP